MYAVWQLNYSTKCYFCLACDNQKARHRYCFYGIDNLKLPLSFSGLDFLEILRTLYDNAKIGKILGFKEFLSLFRRTN